MKVLFVCLGNICRSPLAEGIFKQLVLKQGLDWTVHSAGTASWHKDKAPDLRSIAIAKKMGYDIAAQRARHFTAEMFKLYDYIFVMDKQNYNDVFSLAKDPEEQRKVYFFLEDEAALTDPYYDDALFAPVAAQVEERAAALLAELLKRQ